MISSIVVTYQAKPESVEEHIALIEDVFAELKADQPIDVEYKVMRLADGISFVHVSTADTSDGSNPLTDLESFKAFNANIRARLETAPSATPVTIIGTYTPGGAIGQDGEGSE